MLNEFPRIGYVTLVLPLDTRIRLKTEIQISNHKHCAVIHIGKTNYRIKVGDAIYWNGNREMYWIPAGVEYEQPQTRRNGQRRSLFLDRIVSQQSYAV